MSDTPRTDHVLQHGLMYTGKDELVFLCRNLERENAALRAEVEALRAACDEYALGDERYEYVRRLNAAQFAELYRRNIAENIPFDNLIDAARKESA